jgi:ribosomal protein S18 acetylase RimI-like enzyme
MAIRVIAGRHIISGSPMRIRDARAEDHALFCRFADELGVPDPHPDPERWATDLAPGAFFVEDEGETVGYATVLPRGEAGHVLHVVVAPDRRGRGVGRVVMAEAARRLRLAGCRRWFLNVKEANLTAIALYRRFGMRTAYRSSSLKLDEVAVRALPARAGVTILTLTDDEARAAEAQFALYAGSVNRPPGIGLGAWSGGRLCGAARFVPSMARSAPFKVTDVGVVRPLCDAMRVRLADGSFVKVVIEGQPEVASWLLKLGAIEELKLLHLVGEL